MFYKHVQFRCAPNTSHSNISRFNVAVARVWGMRKSHMPIKHMQNDVLYLNMCVLHVFYKHVRFQGAPHTSHSNISEFKVAAATVSWVSILNMCVSLVFWACLIRQNRFGITIATRNALRDFTCL